MIKKQDSIKVCIHILLHSSQFLSRVDTSIYTYKSVNSFIVDPTIKRHLDNFGIMIPRIFWGGGEDLMGEELKKKFVKTPFCANNTNNTT